MTYRPQYTVVYLDLSKPFDRVPHRRVLSKDRLKRLNLHSLERKRARGDMIEVFKWIKGINKGNIIQIVEIGSQDRTYGNGYKLEKLNSGQI